MSSGKKFDRICIAVFLIMILITALFMNGASFGIRTTVDGDSETFQGDEYFTANDLNADWDTSAACRITLEGTGASIDGNGAYVNDGSVTIKNPGFYVISGELTDGSIIVNSHSSSKVWIQFDGVSVYCSDSAAFRVKKADKVFLTLKEGSVNSLESGETYSDEALEDNINAALWSKDDLTINGSGALTVTAGYKHGIKCSDSLVIGGGTITVASPQDGIHAGDSVRFTGADVTIDSGDDAVHSDKEIYYRDGSLLINNCYEGLEAPLILIEGGEMEIHCSDDGINAGGESEEAQLVHITGGTLTIINENGRDADGIDSNGDILIEGGEVFVSIGGSGNNALDFGSESGGSLYLNGGTVIAAAGSSMMETASSESTQGNITLVLDGEQSAGTKVTLTDEEGNTLLEKEIPCAFDAITLSCPGLETGKTYTVQIGENDPQEIVMEQLTVTVGNAGGFGMHGGGMRGGPMQDGQMQDGGQMHEMPEGETGDMPRMPEGGMGGERPEMPEGETGDMPRMPEGGMGGERPEMPEGETGNMPQMENTPGGPEMDMHSPEADEETVKTGKALSEFSYETWILLGACVVILFVGLIFARKR